jgi:MoaA/NifB/PqqE/SkfB family radical SAM enzyme
MCVLSASKIESYRRVYEDLVTSTCGAMTDDQLRNGIQTVCGSTVKKVELDFVIEVLDLLQEDGPFRSTGVNFEQFMMAGELSACVVKLTPEIRKKINCEDLAERKRKAIMMFFVDANEDCTLSLADLGVLMDAGRIDPRQKEVVLGSFAKHGDSISLLEYLAHIPLFLDVHHDIVEHTLDGRRRLV